MTEIAVDCVQQPILPHHFYLYLGNIPYDAEYMVLRVAWLFDDL